VADISLLNCPPSRLERTEAGEERTRKQQNNLHPVSFVCCRLELVCFFAQVLTPPLCQHRKPRKLRKLSEGLRLGPEHKETKAVESRRFSTIHNTLLRGAMAYPFFPRFDSALFWADAQIAVFLHVFMVSEQEYLHCAYLLEWSWNLTLSMGNC